MHTIDYSASDLSDDEIREHQQRMSTAAAQEARENRLRVKRARNFRWPVARSCSRLQAPPFMLASCYIQGGESAPSMR